MLDALVYYRNGGVSLASNAPTELISMAVLSISGWLIFEYFNFFIRLNWYYPFANLISHDKFLLYAVAGSSAFIPMAFEWYQLLRTFQSLNVKYKFGPKVRFSKGVRIGLLILSVVGMIASSYHPNNLFYVVWLAPLTILTIVLGFLGIWTPFISIRDSGDWSSLLIFAPAFLIQGVFLECANYLSAEHLPSGIKSSNPGFWEYCIPYVKSWRIFEMPLLGYLGYIPFSIYCWIWFISMAFLMNISTSLSLIEDYM
jgi:hypothetical protein